MTDADIKTRLDAIDEVLLAIVMGMSPGSFSAKAFTDHLHGLEMTFRKNRKDSPLAAEVQRLREKLSSEKPRAL